MQIQQNSGSLQSIKLPLRDGAGSMPALGFGTLMPNPVDAQWATEIALRVGFRQFDCAERYRNEEHIGNALTGALREGVAKREDLFITTKLWNTNHRPERVRTAFETSRTKLQVDYVDLYLIHTPYAFIPGDEQDPRDADGKVIYDNETSLLDTWRAMESLVDEGRCKAIGLSDVGLEALGQIFSAARIKPSVVQVESHPYLPEWELLEFCQKRGIILHAFAALGHAMEPMVLRDPVIVGIADRLGKTPAQVLLAWALQRGTALLTTSKTESRIRENFDLSPLPDDAMLEIRTKVTTRVRLNPVVQTGVPGFIPRSA